MKDRIDNDIELKNEKRERKNEKENECKKEEFINWRKTEWMRVKRI